MKRKILSIMLVFCILAAFMPCIAGAEEPTIVKSGTCGDRDSDVTWTLDSNNVLTISGTGKIADNAILFESWDRIVTEVVIEEGVTAIGNYVFAPDFDPYYYLDTTAVQSVRIAGSVKSIGEDAFKECRKLENLTLSDGVTTIGNEAFSHCDSLQNVTLPDSLTSIGERAFEYCPITSIMIPAGVTSIGAAFYACPLTDVTILDGATSICPRAFAGYSRLQSITIPGSVTTIGESAFESCGLTNINIPDGVTTIGESAFKKCSLKSVTIPDSVTTIGKSAFEGCSR